MMNENETRIRVIYLIRHAESESNRLFEESEYKDVPLIFDPTLTDKGRLQAEEIGDKFKRLNVTPDLVITSPLTRAIETMKLSGVLNETKEYITSSLCREIREENPDFFPNESIIYETEDDARLRCRMFLDFLKVFNNSIKCIFVFTHSNFIWYLTSTKKEDGEFYGKWIDNAEWTEINI